MSEGERRLAAIMFTDMVGYTALGQKNELLSLALVKEQRKLIRPILNRHGGREVKTIGDGFLVEFPSALEAVRCAYDIQRAAKELNISLPEDRRVHLRVGVHVGDVVESEGDISGDAVNVASRIEPLAEDGGICLTRQVYGHVQNKFELPLVSLGNRSLKNVSAPLEIYKMVMPWGEEKPITRTRVDKRRIAVLPFANISPDPTDEYFADGMTEELISTMSRISGLSVIARTSVMGYKGGQKKVSEVARELEVGTVLEGSVRKAGDRLRIAVQLIDSQTSGHLWAETYDRELKDVFAIQSDVASKVANSLSAGFFSDAARKDTDDVEAYKFYVRAMQLYHERTEPSLREAIDLFSRSLSRDPEFVRAYAGLSQAWTHLAHGGYEEFTVIEAKAEPAVTKALGLDPGSAEAHSAMSLIHSSLDRFDESIAEAEQAVKINPNLSDAHVTLGVGYSTLKMLDRGLMALKRAYELDPLSVQAGNYLAHVSLLAGKDEYALHVLERMYELNPKNPMIHVGLVEYYMMKRDFTKAQEMLDKGLTTNPREPWLRLEQGCLYALTGRREDAEGSLEEILRDESEVVRLSGQLFIQAALGNYDEAFKALTRQVETHSWPFLIQLNPFLEGLRKDPRYIQFCATVRVPP